MSVSFENPFRPGAGHMPPYLAGRQYETTEFNRLLAQRTIFENLVLTGLRGVGKTVLLDTFRPIAQRGNWLWVGTDLSESTSINEQRMATRLIADLAVITSTWQISSTERPKLVFGQAEKRKLYLDYELMTRVFNSTPGLVADKLKTVLELVAEIGVHHQSKGIVFAYDEAQNLSDHADKEEYPLSLLLDVFQSIQRKGHPFMLALAGLPTLFPKLVAARTFSERMFRVVFLDHLNEKDSRDAVRKPIEDSKCPLSPDSDFVDSIVKLSGGYPYFIQFICREMYDLAIRQLSEERPIRIPMESILRKLDSDFFAGRWAKATDRQRELLTICSTLPNADDEFSISEIVDAAKKVPGTKHFSSSAVNQMFSTLSDQGLVYKNRHGRYAFAVPLLAKFISRHVEERLRRETQSKEKQLDLFDEPPQD